MKSLITKAVAMLMTVGAGLGLTLPAQAQTLSDSDITSMINEMMEQPIPLFLGLPIGFETVVATDQTGEMTDYIVDFQGATILGEPIGTLRAEGEVMATGALKLTFDLLGLATGIAAGNQTMFQADTLRASLQIDPKALAAERITIVADNVLAGEMGNVAENAIAFDGLILDWDERDINPLVTFDVGIDGYAQTIGGVETLSIETAGMSFEIVNTMDWTLQSELNKALTTFTMAQIGMMSPTEGIASLIEQVIPLLRTQQADVTTTIDLGKVSALGLASWPFTGDLTFDGFSIVSDYDHDGQMADTSGTIGALRIDVTDSYAEDIQPFTLLSAEGATLSLPTVYATPYDMNPVADILQDVANDVRGMDPQDIFDPQPEMLLGLSRHLIPLLDWSIETLQLTDAEIELAPLSLTVPDTISASIEGGGFGLFNEVDAETRGDAQAVALALVGLDVQVPDLIDLSLGDISMGYALYDGLFVTRDLIEGALTNSLTLADAIDFVLAYYVPDVEISLADLSIEVPAYVGEVLTGLRLDSALIAFTTSNMATDEAEVVQQVSLSGLDVDTVGLFDPRLEALVLGTDGEPGLAPNSIDLVVSLSDIPMAMIQDLAQSIPLPSVDQLLDPDFDPTSLLLGGAALISPILASPPSVVIPGAMISGGKIGVTIDGSVQINPMMQPNFSVGSYIVSVTGLREAQAEVMALMTEAGADESAAGAELVGVLQQLVGVTTMAAGFGMPAEDGSLQFVIDVPEGAPANVNGFPIPLGF